MMMVIYAYHDKKNGRWFIENKTYSIIGGGNTKDEAYESFFQKLYGDN